MSGLDMRDAKVRVAVTSIVASFSLVALKLTVAFLTNSLGILSEALHSGLDFVAAFTTLYAVRMATRPPDLEHPYGYGKVESLASLVEIALLFSVAGLILYEGIERIFFVSQEVRPTVVSFLIMGFSIVIDLGRSRALGRVASRYGSQALEADALHFRADMVTSAIIIAGLAFVVLGVPMADSYAAIIASVTMVFTSLGLGRRTLDVLLDKAPKGVYARIVESASGLEGVTRVHDIRVRRMGPRTFVDMHIEVPRTYTHEKAHRVATVVEENVAKVIPNSDVIVHADAVESRDETLVDKVRLIAAETEGVRNLHSIYLSRRPARERGGLHLYLDVQVEESLDLAAAHAIVDRFEQRIKEEIPQIREVTAHLEAEASGGAVVGVEQRPDRATVEAIRKLVLGVERVVSCREVAIINVNGQKHITLTIGVAGGDTKLPLRYVHDIVSQAEELIVKKTGAERVVIHAEPE